MNPRQGSNQIYWSSTKSDGVDYHPPSPLPQFADRNIKNKNTSVQYINI